MRVQRQSISMLFGLIVSAALLWVTLHQVDLPTVVSALRRSAWMLAPLFALALGLFCLAKAARWAVLLRGAVITRGRTLLESVVMGYAATTLLPMQLGEVVRAALAARRLRVPTATALVSIAVERVIDLLALLLLFGLTLLVAPKSGESVRAAAGIVAVVVFCAIVVIAAGLISPKVAGLLSRAMLCCVPERLRPWVARQISASESGLAWLREPTHYLPVAALTILQWTGMLACVFITLNAVGIKVPVTACIPVLVCVLLGMSLPSGPAYVGALQLAFVIALAPYGVTAADAVAASVYYQVMLCAPLLLAGLAIVIWRGGWGYWQAAPTDPASDTRSR